MSAAVQRATPDWEARRKAYVAMVEAGMKTTEIAAAFNLKLDTVKWSIRRFGLQRMRNPKLPRVEIEGEVWKSLPDYGVEVSSLGRVYSVRAETLLKPARMPGSVRDSVRVRLSSGVYQRIIIDRLMASAFGTFSPSDARGWLPDEEAALRAARTRQQAIDTIPTRSWRAIEARAARLGVKLGSSAPAAGAPVKGSVPHANPLWSSAHAVVPRNLPEDVRDDLISSMVLLHLEGAAGDMQAALKLAVRERNRVMGAYRECSIDAIVPGTDGLRLIDRLPSTVEHF